VQLWSLYGVRQLVGAFEKRQQVTALQSLPTLLTQTHLFFNFTWTFISLSRSGVGKRMIHRRLSLILFLLSTFTSLVTAQDSKCAAKLAELPLISELRGFRLEMSLAEVKARVPQVVFGPTDALGVSKTSINPDYDPRIDKASFQDVRTVSLDFLDGRVTSLWIGYRETFKWKTADEFVKGISQALTLTNGWTTTRRGQQLRCADFELTVSMVAGAPSFRILDLPAEELLVARRQAKEDEATAAENQNSVIGDSKTKIYYPADCESLKAVPEKIRVTFPSAEEAQKAGYKPSNDCQ
jgi:Metal binding domain of Ada